jgi:hypothetical protein
MANCAALIAMLIALLFGGSAPGATAPTTGAPPAQATQSSGASTATE